MMEETNDGRSIVKIAGVCTDMCPEMERLKRVAEHDVHKLETPFDDMKEIEKGLKNYMIKKFQRSSADHELQIAEMMRTPETLLRTIAYIEDNIMNKADEEEVTVSASEVQSRLSVYLFIWDRYRMIAKDFTLQQHALPLRKVWVECHERMARWFVLMDHRMKASDDYVGGHAQQNGEQLNNLLKTLQSYYFRPASSSSLSPHSSSHSAQSDNQLLENAGEFVGYFLLFQVGNSGEVAKHLQRLPRFMLDCPEVQFSVDVWAAIRTENYVKFFKLLQDANLLQACLMHRYVTEMRVCALRRICKAFAVPGKGSSMPVEYFYDLLMFESMDECVDFLEHCGLELTSDDQDEGEDESQERAFFVIVEGQDVDQLLPLDKNNHPIYPTALHMSYHIEESKAFDKQHDRYFTVQDICRGLVSVPFSLESSVRPPSLFQPSTSLSHPYISSTPSQPADTESDKEDAALPGEKKKIALPSFLKKKPQIPASPQNKRTDKAADDGLIPVKFSSDVERRPILSSYAGKPILEVQPSQFPAPFPSSVSNNLGTNEQKTSIENISENNTGQIANKNLAMSSSNVVPKPFAPTLFEPPPSSQPKVDRYSLALTTVTNAANSSHNIGNMSSFKFPSSLTPAAPVQMQEKYVTESILSLAQLEKSKGRAVGAAIVNDDKAGTDRSLPLFPSLGSSKSFAQSAEEKATEQHPIMDRDDLSLGTERARDVLVASNVSLINKKKTLEDYYPQVSAIRELFLQSIAEQVALNVENKIIRFCFRTWLNKHRTIQHKRHHIMVGSHFRRWKHSLLQRKENAKKFQQMFNNFTTPNSAKQAISDGKLQIMQRQREVENQKRLQAEQQRSYFSFAGNNSVNFKLLETNVSQIIRFKLSCQLASYDYSSDDVGRRELKQLQNMIIKCFNDENVENNSSWRSIEQSIGTLAFHPVYNEYAAAKFNVEDINLGWSVLLVSEAAKSLMYTSRECPVVSSIRKYLANKEGFLANFSDNTKDDVQYLCKLYENDETWQNKSLLISGVFHSADKDSTDKGVKCYGSIYDFCPISNKSNPINELYVSSPALIQVLTFSVHSADSDLSSYIAGQLESIRMTIQNSSPIAFVYIINSAKRNDFRIVPGVVPNNDINWSDTFVEQVHTCLDNLLQSQEWRLSISYSLIIKHTGSNMANDSKRATRFIDDDRIAIALSALLLLLLSTVKIYPIVGRVELRSSLDRCFNTKLWVGETSRFSGESNSMLIHSAGQLRQDLLQGLDLVCQLLCEVKDTNAKYANILRYYSNTKDTTSQAHKDHDRSDAIVSGIDNAVVKDVLVLQRSKVPVLRKVSSLTPCDALHVSIDRLDVLLFFFKSVYDHMSSSTNISIALDLGQALDDHFISLLQSIHINATDKEMDQEGLSIAEDLYNYVRSTRDGLSCLPVLLRGLRKQLGFVFRLYLHEYWDLDFFYFIYSTESFQLLVNSVIGEYDELLPMTLSAHEANIKSSIAPPHYNYNYKRKFDEVAVDAFFTDEGEQREEEFDVRPNHKRSIVKDIQQRRDKSADCLLDKVGVQLAAEKEYFDGIQSRLETELKRGLGIRLANDTQPSSKAHALVDVATYSGNSNEDNSISNLLLQLRREQSYYDRINYYYERYK